MLKKIFTGLIVFLALSGLRAASADAPHIFFMAPGNEADTLLVLGSGLDTAATDFIYWCPEPLIDYARGKDWHQGPHADAVKEAGTVFLPFLGRTPALPTEPPERSTLYRNNPATRKAQPAAVRGFAGNHRTAYEIGSDRPTGYAARVAWLRTKEGTSNPYLHNAPQAWWLDLDEAVPGQRVRLYGIALTRNTFPPFRIVALRSKADDQVYEATWGSPTNIGNIYSGDLTWEVRFEVPNCPAGEYEVYVHKGDAGIFGWTRGMTLKVVAPTAGQVRRVDARQAGAAGDGKKDDAAAIAKAAADLAAQGGGALYLPAGQYLLGRTIEVPSGVLLRGASRGGTVMLSRDGGNPVLRLSSRTGVEDLTLRQAKAGPAALAEIGDGKAPVRDVRLSGLMFDAEAGNAEALKPGQWQALSVVSPAYGLEVTNCDLGARRFMAVMKGMERSRITYNTSGIYLEGYMKRCVIEYNESRGGGGFIFKATSGDIADNYLQWNRVVDAPTTALGGGYLFESVSPDALQGRVMSLEGNRLRLIGAGGKLSGRMLVIVSGEGRGQVLSIESVKGNEVTLAEEPLVAPQPGDMVYLGPLVHRNIIVNNFHVRCNNAVTLRGASSDNFLARLPLAQTDGIRLVGVETGGRVYPCYRNTMSEMNVFGGGSVGFAADTQNGKPAGVLLMGNSIGFQSRVYRAADIREKPLGSGAFWLSALGKAPTEGAVLGECNLVNARVVTPVLEAGTYVGVGFNDTFVKCVYDNTDASLSDAGQGTQVLK